MRDNNSMISALKEISIRVFILCKRKIIYVGNIYSNIDSIDYSCEQNSIMYWCDSFYSTPADYNDVIELVLKTKKSSVKMKLSKNMLSGRYIDTDTYYNKLSDFPYPLSSTCIKKSEFCFLSPYEIKVLDKLVFLSKYKTEISHNDYGLGFDISKDVTEYLTSTYRSITSVFSSIEKSNDNYLLCSNVPISPFNPVYIDKADICAYSINDAIKEGTIPNIIIEFGDKDTYDSMYQRAFKKLDWLSRICSKSEFNKITVYIIADIDMSIDKQWNNSNFSANIIFVSLKATNIMK